jgi:hypothetical protein
MSDFIELSSPYGTGSFGFGNRPRTRQSIRGLGHLPGKSISAQYDPISTPQEEYNSGAFQLQNDQHKAPATTTLGAGRIGKFGADLLIEIFVSSFALLVSVPFLWLAVTMAKYDGQTVTQDKSDYIKQATSTVRSATRAFCCAN